MKKTILVRSLVITLALWLWAGQALVASAHDGPPRVEIGADQVSPGAMLEVRGVNIAAEQQVTVDLVGPNADIPLGVTVGDVHGDFTQVFVLPADLSPGAYSIRAVGANRVIVGVSLSVMSTGAVSNAEEGGQRDDDEPLLVPLPQRELSAVRQQQVQPTAEPPVEPQVPNVETPIPAQDEPSALQEPSMLLAIGVVVLLVLVLGLVLMIRRRLANAA